MVVASAPTYPQGVIDPVGDIAALALRRGILCHVDACMGGYLLPFLRDLGRLDPVDGAFDFRVPGVTSMSADVHKYGYASKGVSVILYRDHELARKQLFVTKRLARRLLRVDRDGGHPAGRARSPPRGRR